MKPPRYSSMQKYNPFRSVDWRWQRAQGLVAKWLRFLPRRDDESTLRAAHYLRALQRVETDRQATKVRQQFHDIHTAERIAARPGRTKLEIEARLLTGIANEEVAVKCALEIETILAYESLFFQVSDRLRATDFILRVIGFSVSTGLARNIDSVIKSFAYFQGSAMLDLTLAALDAKRLGPMPLKPGTTDFPPHLLRRAQHAIAGMLLRDKPGWGVKIHQLTADNVAYDTASGAESVRIDVDLDRVLANSLRTVPAKGSGTTLDSVHFEEKTQRLA